MFMLAESLRARERYQEAKVFYHKIIAPDDEQENTLPYKRLSALSRHRLQTMHHHDRDEVLPMWPNGVTSCIACHSHSADLQLPTSVKAFKNWEALP